MAWRAGAGQLLRAPARVPPAAPALVNTFARELRLEDIEHGCPFSVLGVLLDVTRHVCLAPEVVQFEVNQVHVVVFPAKWFLCPLFLDATRNNTPRAA